MAPDLMRVLRHPGTPTLRRIRHGVITIALVVGLPASPALSDDAWSGTWDTLWPGGGARLLVNSDGDRVAGTYQPGDGAVEGTVAAGELTGIWQDKSGRGTFQIRLSGDGTTFFGRFGSGLWWTGERVGPSRAEPAFEADLSSPRAVLRSFLIAANNVRLEQFEFVEAALSCLDQDSVRDATLARDHGDRALLFFDLIDRTTLRLADVPSETDASEIVLSLAQAGTEELVDVTIARRGEHWRIVVPSHQDLHATFRRLRDARTSEPQGPLAHLDLANPRATMRTFLEEYKSWDSGGRAHVLATLDLDELTPALLRTELPLLATYLKQTIDRVGYVIYQEIPDDPNRQIPYVHFRHPAGDIAIAPTIRDDRVAWRFTPQTLADIRSLYEELEDVPLASNLIPDREIESYFRVNDWIHRHFPALTTVRWGLELWQWMSLLVAILVATLSAYVADVGARRLITRGSRRRGEADRGRRRVRVFTPLAITLGVGLAYLAMTRIGLPLEFFPALHGLAVTVLVAGLTWTAYVVSRHAQDYFGRLAGRTISYYDELLVSVVGSVVRFAIVVIGLVVVVRELGVPLGGLLAGVGLGGLAFGFAARDTLANFIGSLVLLSDRPFRRGELVAVAGHKGFVQRMGLRSTQMRTLDDSLLTIPNNILINDAIDNLGRRRVRRVVGTVSVTYGIKPDTLDALAEGLKNIMIGHDRIRDSDSIAGTWALAESSIDLQFVCYVEAATEAQERQIRHELLIEITRLAERMGVDFAFPTRTVHFAGSASGLDPNGRQEAAESETSPIREDLGA